MSALPHLIKREVHISIYHKPEHIYQISATTPQAIHDFIKSLNIPGSLTFNYAAGGAQSIAIFKTSHHHKLLES
jgi:hypothetical protein